MIYIIAALLLGEGLYLNKDANQGLIIVNIIIIILTTISIVVLFCTEKCIRKSICKLIRRIILGIIVMTLINLGYVINQNFTKDIYSIEKSFKGDERVNIYGTVDKVSEKENSIYYYLKNVHVSNTKKSVKVKSIIILLDKQINNLKIGMQVNVYGNYDSYEISRNDGGFNERRYYYEQGIAGTFKCRAYAVSITGKKNSYKDTLSYIKNRCTNLMYEMAGEKYGGIYNGILFGEKSGIDKDTKELYKLTGISHLLAISGLHISLIGYFIYKMFRKFMGYFPSGLMAAVIIISYGEMVGDSVSTKRALIMFALQLTAQWLGRTYDIISALSVALVVLVVDNPLCITNSGLLMSFGAIIGVTVVFDLVRSFLECENRIIKSLIASECINAVTRPVIAYFYYEIPIYSAIINIIVIPFMGIVVACGFIGLMIGIVNIWLGSLIIKLGCLILKLYDLICKFFIKIPFSNKIIGKPSLVNIILYYIVLIFTLVIIWFFLREKRKNNAINTFKVRIIKSGEVCVIVVILFLIINYRGIGSIKVQMIDVGQGDSICINDGENVILVDCGSSSTKEITKYTVMPFLKANGIEKIDYLIMTHSDSDHINGMKELMNYKYNMKNYVKNIILPDINKELIDDEYEEIESLAKKNHIKILYFKRNDKIEFKNVKIECICPKSGQILDKNDLSVTFYLKTKYFNMLFTGDLGEAGEKQLIEDGLLKDVDILKVGHHGSNGSSSQRFLEEITPQVSLISCGEDNRYGHPGEKTMDRLKRMNTDIYVTMSTGQINIISRKNGFVVETFLD